MASQAEIRTGDLKRIITAFEQERDKLLDQVQYIKGNADRIEWVIKVMNNQVTQIEQEEITKAKLAEQQEAAMKAARERGNVGAHPSSRSGDLAERRKEAQLVEQPQQQESELESSSDPAKKKSKKQTVS